MSDMRSNRLHGVSRRGFLGGAALAGAGTLLGACGLQAGPSGDGEAMAKDDAPAKQDAKAPAAEGAVPVLLWQWGTTYVPGFETLVTEYNEIQEEVALTVEQPSGYWDSVLAAIAAQTGPDIFLMNGVNIKSWASGGRVVTDLSQYISSDKQASDGPSGGVAVLCRVVFTGWQSVRHAVELQYEQHAVQRRPRGSRRLDAAC